VPRLIRAWTKPIVIGRHAFGDQYKATELVAPGAGKLEMVFTPTGGGAKQTLKVLDDPADGGVGLAMYNTNESIRELAKTCLEYALLRTMPLYVTTKNTIVKQSDGTFLRTFAVLYEKDYKAKFEKAGMWYEHRLIDDMVASGKRKKKKEGRIKVHSFEWLAFSAIKSDGGLMWAAKNDDGDVQSDMVAQGYGSYVRQTVQRWIVLTRCQAWSDDVGAGVPRRKDDGGGGGARHSDAALPRAPQGQRNQHQSHRVHLRLDTRSGASV
jgi:isocitrate dehydrogenase